MWATSAQALLATALGGTLSPSIGDDTHTNALFAGVIAPDAGGLGMTGNGPGVSAIIAPYMIVGGNLSVINTTQATKNSLTWKSYFPMAYNISLANTHATDAGLILANDLKFVGNGNFTKLGNIAGAGYNIELSPRASFFPLPAGSTVVISGAADAAALNIPDASAIVIRADQAAESTSTVSCGWWPDYNTSAALSWAFILRRATTTDMNTGSDSNDTLTVYSYDGSTLSATSGAGNGAISASRVNGDGATPASLFTGAQQKVNALAVVRPKTLDGGILAVIGRDDPTPGLSVLASQKENLLVVKFIPGGSLTASSIIGALRLGTVATPASPGPEVQTTINVIGVSLRPFGTWNSSYAGSHCAVLYSERLSTDAPGVVKYYLDVIKIRPDGTIEGPVASNGGVSTSRILLGITAAGKVIHSASKVVSWSGDATKLVVTLRAGSLGGGVITPAVTTNCVQIFDISATGKPVSSTPFAARTIDSARIAAFHPFLNQLVVGVGIKADESTAGGRVQAYQMIFGPSGATIDPFPSVVKVDTGDTTTRTYFDFSWNRDGSIFSVSSNKGVESFLYNPGNMQIGAMPAITSFGDDLATATTVPSLAWSPVHAALLYRQVGITGSNASFGIRKYTDSISAGGGFGFNSVRLVLNSDITLTAPLFIDATDTIIEGNGHTLTIADGVRITIQNAKMLTLRNTVLKVRGKQINMGGITKSMLDSIMFMGAAASLKLDAGSVLSLLTDIFVPTGIISVADAISRIDTQGKKLEYGNQTTQFAGGSNSNFTGGTFTGGAAALTGKATFDTMQQIGSMDLGGQVAIYNDNTLPSGITLDLLNPSAQVRAGAGCAPFATDVRWATWSPDGTFCAYVNNNVTASGTYNLYVDQVNNTGQGIVTVVRKAQLIRTNAANDTGTSTKSKDGAVIQVDWKPGSPTIFATLISASQASVTRKAFVKLYNFTPGATVATTTSGDPDTGPLRPIASAMGGELVPLSTDAATLKAVGFAWFPDGNRFAVALTDTADVTKNYIRVHDVSFTGSINQNPSATVTITGLTDALSINQLRTIMQPGGAGMGGAVPQQRIVFATATKVGVVEYRGPGNMSSIGGLLSLSAPKIAPHPQGGPLMIAEGTNLRAFMVDPAGNLQDQNMFIPVGAAINTVTWHKNGLILALATVDGLAFEEFNPKTGIKPVINRSSGVDTARFGTAGYTNSFCSFSPDGKTIIAGVWNGAVYDVAFYAIPSKGGTGSLGNGTMQVMTNLLITAPCTVDGDLIFDCSQSGAGITLAPDAIITVAPGKTLTIKGSKVGFGGLRGTPSGSNFPLANLILGAGSTLKLDNSPLASVSPITFTTGTVESTGDLVVVSPFPINFSDDGTSKLVLPKGASLKTGTGVGRPNMNIPALAKGYDTTGTSDFKNFQSVSSALVYDSSQNMQEKGQVQKVTFDKAGATQSYAGTTSGAPTEIPITDSSQLGTSGNGITTITGNVVFNLGGTVATKNDTQFILEDTSQIVIADNSTLTIKGVGNLVATDNTKIIVGKNAKLILGTAESAATDQVGLIVKHNAALADTDATSQFSHAYGRNDVSIMTGGKLDFPQGMVELNGKDGAMTPNSSLTALNVVGGLLDAKLSIYDNSVGSTKVNFSAADLTAQPTIQYKNAAGIIDPLFMITTANLKGDMSLPTLNDKASIDPANKLGVEHLTPGDVLPNQVKGADGSYTALPSAASTVIGSYVDGTGKEVYQVHVPATGPDKPTAIISLKTA